MSEPQPEPAGGPFLRTIPGTQVKITADGFQFTDPDGTVTFRPWPDEDEDDDDEYACNPDDA